MNILGSQIPFNFDLITRTKRSSTAPEFKQRIETWINSMPNGKGIEANWVLGNHDQRRLASRYNPSRIDVFNILLKTLPGITITYHVSNTLFFQHFVFSAIINKLFVQIKGEEIGMTDVWISWKDTQDPQACRTNPNIYESYSRDPARTPFQWDSSANSGFSIAEKTWLPLADNYTECNVELQESQENTHLKVFRQLITLRGSPTLKYGGLQIEAVDDDVLVYKRQIDGQDADVFVVVLNLGTTDKVVDLNASLSGVPSKLKVAVSSIQSNGPAVGYVIENLGNIGIYLQSF